MRHPDPTNSVSSVIKMARSERAEWSQFRPAPTILVGDLPPTPQFGMKALLPIPRELLKEIHILPEGPDAWGDILIAPDPEAANMLASQLIDLAGADSAAVVLGARGQIVLTSRADVKLAHLASRAITRLLVHHRTAGQQ